MFKILGEGGSFGSAIKHLLESVGGKCSNTEYQWVIPCVPSYALEELELEPEKRYILVSKGMTISGLLVTEWAFKNNLDFAFIAGPHFAKEIIQGLPTTTTIAGSKENFDILKDFFPKPLYSSARDFIALASVMKNIIAYGCGMCSKQGLGENFKASLITQGLRELLEVASFLDIKYQLSQDLLQPGVLSDFVLTGSSPKSRNFTAGYDQLLVKKTKVVVESMHSAELLIKRIGFSGKWPVLSLVAKAINGEKVDFTNSIASA